MEYTNFGRFALIIFAVNFATFFGGIFLASTCSTMLLKRFALQL